MKVLIFRNQLFKLSESFITNQAEALLDFEPTYLGRNTFGDSPENAKVITLKDKGVLDNIKYVLFRDVNNLQDKFDSVHYPSLIHAHFGVEGVYALRLADRLKIPVVTTFHGFDATTTVSSLLLSGRPAWINYALHRKELIKKGALFICVSDFIRKKVIAMGFPEDRTVTHYIGIDLSEPPLPKEEMPYKVILHVARLTEKKGTKYLIEAFFKVAKSSKDSKLIIIGDGPLKKELLELVNELNLGNKVEFLGSQPNNVVLEWMARADVFCLPSVTAQSGDTEGLPITILEAAKNSVATLSTFHAGIPEAVIDGETGFLVPEKSSEHLVQKLCHLLEDDALRSEMGEKGRKLIEDKFNLKVQTEQLEKLYQSVLS